MCLDHPITWSGTAMKSFSRHEEMHGFVFTQQHVHPPTHTHTHTEFLLTLRPNTPQPRLTFRHRACCWVIALLINVFPSQDNGLVFTLCFSRLARKDIQWRNLLQCIICRTDPFCGGGRAHCFEVVVRSLIYQCSMVLLLIELLHLMKNLAELQMTKNHKVAPTCVLLSRLDFFFLLLSYI